MFSTRVPSTRVGDTETSDYSLRLVPTFKLFVTEFSYINPSHQVFFLEVAPDHTLETDRDGKTSDTVN